jgi:hypothetical protein
MSMAQKNNIIGPDTIVVKKGKRVTHGNISFIPKNDTIIIVHDSVFFKTKTDPQHRSEIFYDSIESKADRNLLTKSLYDITFVSHRPVSKDTVLNIKSETPFVPYIGKTIRNIKIKRLDVFGTDVHDTTLMTEKGFGNFLNNVHINSREWVIKQNIKFKSGDIVDAIILAENERILRQLPYIEDAVIIVKEIDSNTVDIYVITKDVWSIIVVPVIKSASSATLRIYDANILGFGHKFSNEIAINTKEPGVLRYKRVSYEVNNIMGSFIRGYAEYNNNPDEKLFNAYISRPFAPPILNVAGGAGYKRTDRLTNFTIFSIDTIVEQGNYVFDVMYGWIGKTFPLNLPYKENENKSYFTLSAKYSKKNYLEHQEYPDERKYFYENQDLILVNASVSKNNYVLTNLIYSYGKTEDIAYGYNVTLTIGEKFGEFKNEPYTGISLSYGKFNEKGRYLYTRAEYGGFIRNGAFNRGVIKLRGTVGSGLTNFLGSPLRNYATIRYTQGISRIYTEKIYLNDDHGYRGVSTYESLSGIKRLNLNFESVLFTPFYFLGFRFAAFAYMDNGLITFNNKIFQTSNYYMGLGLGLRIRNENLIFRTFQIDLSFYPVRPDEINPVYLSLKNVDGITPANFNPKAPNIISFE